MKSSIHTRLAHVIRTCPFDGREFPIVRAALAVLKSDADPADVDVRLRQNLDPFEDVGRIVNTIIASTTACVLGGCHLWNVRFQLPPSGPPEKHVRIVDPITGKVKNLYFRGHAVPLCQPCREAEEALLR